MFLSITDEYQSAEQTDAYHEEPHIYKAFQLAIGKEADAQARIINAFSYRQD